MSNSLLTIDMITRKSLEILENNLVLTRNVNRAYDDSFAVEGAKIGSTLRIRLPDRALVTDGAALQVQDDNEQYTTLAVSSQKHIGVNFTSAELTMQLDDFAERVLKPRVSQLASTIDADVANAYKGIYASVGTPGTTPATSLVLLQAQQKLNEYATPMNERFATVNPAANAGLVEGMKGFFNPTNTISRQFATGMMGTGVLGYDEVNMSQSILNHTTGSLQQFVVTALNTSAGTEFVDVAVQPPMYTAANALATIDAFPVADALITYVGAASTGYAQNLVYNKNAITFATADLLLPQGVDMASRQVHNGISLRIVRQYDINNDRLPCRIDVLYGYSTIRPQMAARIWG